MIFHFVGEEGTAKLYNILSSLHFQTNLVQTGAVILQLCVDDIDEKITKLAQEASQFFDVRVEKGLNTSYNQTLPKRIAGKDN